MDLLIFKTRVLRFFSDTMTSLKNAFQYSRGLVFTLCLFTGAWLSVPSAIALSVPETPPSAWNQGSFGVQTSSEYFMSKANYGDSRGSFERLINDNRWTSFENRVKVRYGFTPTTSLFLGVGANATSATDLGIQKNNSAPTELFAGMDFLLARRWWRVVPEIEASYSFDSTTRGQTSPITSDAASYAKAGVFMFKPYKYLRFEGYLGAHIPGGNFASRFMYQLGTEVALFGAFTVGAAVQGYESLVSDTTSNLERKFTQATADATDARFFAYNPALLEAKGWIGFRFDRAFGLRLGYLKTLNGVRSGEGQSFLLSLFYNSPGNASARRYGPPSVQVGATPVSPKPRQDGFKTEAEPNDPELFEQQQQQPNDSLDNTERLFDHK